MDIDMKTSSSFLPTSPQASRLILSWVEASRPFLEKSNMPEKTCNNDIWRLPKESLLAPDPDSEVSQLTSPTQAHTLPNSFLVPHM